MGFLFPIPVVPFVGFLLNFLLGARRPAAAAASPHGAALDHHGGRPSPIATAIGVGASALAFLLALRAVGAALQAPGHTIVETAAPWIPGAAIAASGGTRFSVDWSFALDPLTAVMVLVVTFVGLLIHVYSIGYMGGDPGYPRFMAYLNLFLFAMLVLVLAANYLVLFVGWEGVGLCSYLLIGFWYEKKSAADAGKKAFIVNRVGDAFFLLGIFLVFTTFGTLDFRSVASQASALPIEHAGGVLTLIALLLFGGACGKSAQIPLHVWLPDAMEGPTPVSALIHAATMVTAGVYVVARSSALYAHAPRALVVVALVGATTAFVAATIGLVQNDIKRVLAYSTVSQLGYMFLACGVGAFSAAVFHLTTHAFFKALLFLAAGSVIHGLSGEQDMRRMGGLRTKMPWTHATTLVGCLAIAGIPPLAGFFSKDEILWSAFGATGPGRVVWVLGVATAALTAFYMFRLYTLTFAGRFRGDDHHHVHESGLAMRLPLVVLATGAVVVGFLGVPEALGGSQRFASFLHGVVAAPVHGEAESSGSHALELGLMGLSVAVAAAGSVAGWRLFAGASATPARIAATFPALHRALSNKYYFDEFYDAAFVRGAALGGGRLFHATDRTLVDGGDGEVRSGLGVNGLAWLCRDIVARFSNAWDRIVVDGLVNLTAAIAENLSFLFRSLQNGLIQHYAWLMLVGIFLLVIAGRYVVTLE